MNDNALINTISVAEIALKADIVNDTLRDYPRLDVWTDVHIYTSGVVAHPVDTGDASDWVYFPNETILYVRPAMKRKSLEETVADLGSNDKNNDE